MILHVNHYLNQLNLRLSLPYPYHISYSSSSGSVFIHPTVPLPFILLAAIQAFITTFFSESMIAEMECTANSFTRCRVLAGDFLTTEPS